MSNIEVVYVSIQRRWHV